MRSVSHKVIYIVLQFSGNSPARIFFSLIFADFERRIGASEIFEHHKNRENTHGANLD